MAQRLRKLFRRREEVVLAYLFGSAVEGEVFHDVDIAVLTRSEDRLKVLASLVEEVSRALGVEEGRVDIVDLERAGLSLKRRILTQGVKLVDRGGFEDKLRLELSMKYSIAMEDFKLFSRLWLEEDPKVNGEVVLRRLDEVLKSSSLIRRYLGRDEGWFLEDLERAYAFERALHRAIEVMLGICRHVVSAKRLGIPEYCSEYPTRIAEAGLMDRRLADQLSELARLRNVLIHQYAELDYGRLMEAAKKIVEKVVPRFTEWVRELLRAEASTS